MAVMRMVGARVKRVEDPRLITGQSTYVDDLRLVDLLYAAVARSPIAHGRIRGIDVARARAAPGVASGGNRGRRPRVSDRRGRAPRRRPRRGRCWRWSGPSPECRTPWRC